MEDSVKNMVKQPMIPRADNFTPRERTPWGGLKIAGDYKKWLGLDVDQVIGESWEISGHKSFPNRFTAENGEEVTLPELLAKFPKEILGQKIAEKFDNRIPLLIKLLDAADNLSVQVHPNDFYNRLKPGEMGKTETWYILDADPGCGIYLGLTESATREELEQAVLGGQDISQYLNFVPVKPGEIYYIPAGTIHAIGKGVTLIEPQQTSETTYRFWDWNRRYDAAGRQTADGKARELHVEDSFAVSTFSGLRGSAFVDSIKGKPTLLFEDAGNTVYQLLKTDQFVVEKVHLSPSHPLALHKEDLFQAFVVLDGAITIKKADGFSADVRRGQSFLIPASVTDFELVTPGANAAVLIKVFYPLF